MSPTQLKHAAALALTAGLTAAAVTVAPTLAADSPSTTTTTTPKTAKGHARPCPGGPKGERGPAALRISMAAMRPDPPADPPKNGTRAKGPGKRNGPPPGGPAGADRLANRTAHYAAIGKALGKDTASVTAAVRTALSDELAARVKDGTITQERADAVLKAWDSGKRPAKPAAAKKAKKARKAAKRAKGTRPTHADMAAEIAAFRKDVATALGVSTDDLIAAIKTASPKPPAGDHDNG
jgi:hypothetical protein